ncbi:MAG TPA: DUF177 domain-containing protein [Vicinamibacteria bacterium]|nr:DUF177 domain-containing protein [Vicinamibacteria bacterium]
MFIDLDRVPLEGQAVDRTFTLEPSSLANEEFKLLTPATVSGRLEPVREDDERASGAEDVFRLRGRMACRIELACVRCLEPFPMDLAEELDLLYLPQSSNVGPKTESEDDESGRGLEPEEVAVSFYRDERIDLSQMIVEQIVLALPMKPLCKADCRGLCPQCGVNRNLSSCDCAPEDTDPRWAPLRTLSKSRRS